MMNRRNMLKLLGLGAALPWGSKAAALLFGERQLKLICTTINGMAHYEGTHSIVTALQVGETLRLRREPENAYDEKAIEVFTQGGQKLGYVPRADNAVLANLADQAWMLRAAVDGAEPDQWPYDCVRITIYGHPE